jgi:hypothetical protein
MYKTQSPWIYLISVFTCLFLASCAAEAPTAPTTLAPCQSINPLIYTGDQYPEMQSNEAKKVAEEIFAFAQNGDIPKARREALRFLWYETERWSDVQYRSFEGGLPSIRVITTFLTPGLVRAIVLNHLVYKYDPQNPPNLEQETRLRLEELDKRNEFGFLLIIQSDTSTIPHNFSIAAGDILLRTTAGRQVSSTHNDNFVNIPLPGMGIYSGLLFYPAAAIINNNCSPVLEPNMETSLLMVVDNARWADQVNIGFTWHYSIPLFVELNKPLFDLRNEPVDNQDYLNDAPQIDIQFTNDSFKNGEKNNIVWREVGRYIWNKLILDNVPQVR